MSVADPCEERWGGCESAAVETGRRYGAEHVVPLTGGLRPEDTFIYWFINDAGEESGYIRGSYTRKPLKP